MHKRTKIIATIGPASSAPAIITKLIHAGMDAVRLNFSHGERKDHNQRIRLVRQAAAKAGKQNVPAFVKNALAKIVNKSRPS